MAEHTNPLKIEFWEPEETIGKLWHGFASKFDSPISFQESTVSLSDFTSRLYILFRGLGGDHKVEIRPVSNEESHHRLSLIRKLGTAKEIVPRASFDGEILRLPAELAILPNHYENLAVYYWLTAMAVSAPTIKRPSDQLQSDLQILNQTGCMISNTFKIAPRLQKVYFELAQSILKQRSTLSLPPVEKQIEKYIRHLLGETISFSESELKLKTKIETGKFDEISAPRSYRSFQPIPLWIDLRELNFSQQQHLTDDPSSQSSTESAEEKTIKAQRKKSDQVERPDSLILHKFESILSWAEFLNLNRTVEDDDLDNAKKALEDQNEIGLGQNTKSPATKLKIHLDLSPEDVERERISGQNLYPEWNTRTNSYLNDHVCVFSSVAEIDSEPNISKFDQQAKIRIRSVKRQFEALRPGKVVTRGHFEGENLDLDLAVRSQIDQSINGFSNDRVWLKTRTEARDLAVMILVDVSRSTESAVDGQMVLDIEKEALTALAWGLNACNDAFAIASFSSLKRHRVYVQTCKSFSEPMNSIVENRISNLKPGYYTRLGAAIRHTTEQLSIQPQRRKLLLIITDGKPNDLDHYEGRHGIEDTRMAIKEARRLGNSVFGITIDESAKQWFPRLFGQGGFAVVPNPNKLTLALPKIYFQLVGGQY